MGTKTNPGKFDCYKEAGPDEPIFILLGRDPVAHLLVSLWASVREKMGKTSEDKLHDAHRCSVEMEDYCRKTGKRVDDAWKAYHKVLRDDAIADIKTEKELRAALKEAAQTKKGKKKQ